MTSHAPPEYSQFRFFGQARTRRPAADSSFFEGGDGVYCELAPPRRTAVRLGTRFSQEFRSESKLHARTLDFAQSNTESTSRHCTELGSSSTEPMRLPPPTRPTPPTSAEYTLLGRIWEALSPDPIPKVDQDEESEQAQR